MSRSDEEGYLNLTLRLFGAEVFQLRIAVDDFHTKWVIIGLASVSALTLLAIEAKELL